MTYEVGGTIRASLAGALGMFGEGRKYVGFGILV
jgi:hypothetical protein